MASRGGWRPESTLPEIAFAGRSNVGKSSLLNRLIHRKKLARVSNTPGRTREVNFFRVNDTFVLVDLPGYGYARVSKEQRAEWRPLIEEYHAQQRAAARHRAAARRTSRPDDRRLTDARFPQRDRGSDHRRADEDRQAHARTQRTRAVVAIARELGLDAEQVIPFSAVTGEGRDDLAEAIEELLAQPSWRALQRLRERRRCTRCASLRL